LGCIRAMTHAKWVYLVPVVRDVCVKQPVIIECRKK